MSYSQEEADLLRENARLRELLEEAKGLIGDGTGRDGSCIRCYWSPQLDHGHAPDCPLADWLSRYQASKEGE